MASFTASTDDVKIEFQNTQPKSDVRDTEQASGNKQGDGIYEQPTEFKDERIEGKQSKQNNWLLKCFMALVILLVVTVALLAILFVVLMFLTLSAFNETNEIKDQQTDASRMNELADALTNISKRIETMEAKFARLKDDWVNVSSRTETVETNLDEFLCVNDAAFDKVGAEIVFQRRERFDISFYRGFEDYETGFGDYCGAGDLWLGLKKLHQKTENGKWHLRLSMRSFSDYVMFWSEWTDFKIHSAPLYTLTFGRLVAKSDTMQNTTGTDSGLEGHNRMAFTTYDRDQDMLTTGNCAIIHTAGWWHKECHKANLNGKMATSATVNYGQMSFHDGKGWKMISWSEMKMIRVA